MSLRPLCWFSRILQDVTHLSRLDGVKIGLNRKHMLVQLHYGHALPP